LELRKEKDMTKKEIRTFLKGYKGLPIHEQYEEDGEIIFFEYLGSFMTLDPCGRYHHVLSPNGVTAKCERFWQNLHHVAYELDGWIKEGEGDPTDIYFEWRK
jgi:hypothetical protein